MASSALKDKQVVAMAEKFVPILMDLDTDTEWAERHRIVGIPAFQFCDTEGEVIATTSGIPVPEFTERLLEDGQDALDFLADDGEDDEEDEE